MKISVAMILCLLAAMPAMARSIPPHAMVKGALTAGNACGLMRENVTISFTVPGGVAQSPEGALAQLGAKFKELQELTKTTDKITLNSQSYTINGEPQTASFIGQLSVSYSIGTVDEAWKLAEVMAAKNYPVNVNVNGYRDGNCAGVAATD